MPLKPVFILNTPIIGGAEKYLVSVIKHLEDTVAVLPPKGLVYNLMSKAATESIAFDMGECVEKWRGLNLLLPTNLILHRRFVARLKGLKSQGVNIVHVQALKEQLLVSPAAKEAGLPVIWTQHLPLTPWMERTPLKKAFVRAANQHTDRIIAVSGAVKQSIVDLGVDPEKIEVVHVGIDLERFSPGDASDVREELGIAPHEILIGCTSRLHRLKGQHVLIKALPDILRRHPNVKCILVGTGSRKAHYRQLAAEAGLSGKVIFTGFTDNVPDYVQAMDVYVCPSFEEGFPATVLEAMACCKPVVSTIVGGTPEQITNNEDGILIPQGDPVAIANAVNRILENLNLARELGRKARQTCEEQFNKNLMVDKTINLFKRVVDGSY